MAPMTEEEVDRLLRDCTNYKSKTYTYVRLLGFHQLSLSRSESGPQRYSGIVQEFNEATKDVISAHAGRYNSRKDVWEAVRDKSLLPSIANECLAKYGPHIWGNGDEEVQITLCDEFYPNHLVFDDAHDRERIRTYTFCWILQRMCRKVEEDRREARKMAEAEDDEDDDDNSLYRSTAAPKMTTLKNIFSEPRAKEKDATPTVPALASVSDNARHEKPSAILGRTHPTESSLLATNDCVEVAVPSKSPVSPKHRTSTAKKGGGTNISHLPRDGKLKSIRNLKRRGSSSGASRFIRRPNPFDVQPPLNAIFGEEAAIYDISESEVSIHDGHTPNRSHRHLTIGTDSTQGDASELKMEEEHAARSFPHEDSPSLIVTLNLERPQLPQVRGDRKRLALALLNGIKIDARTRNRPDNVFALISSIRKADSHRLRETLADAYTPYMDVLDQWLQGVEIMHTFQEGTGFYGKQDAWVTHFASLDNASRIAAMRYLLQAGIAMEDWIAQRQRDFTIHGFSADLADTLISLADWMGSMHDGMQQSFKDGIMQLNDGMLGWFSQSN